ncbi:MAG: UDP-N-acetylmuramoyl-L-alanine--D-glutamate ligase [Acidobacteriota bacterium]|nr:UDP-N-acetylmuramoyl-L-alanine--D-glutamate ligase [Acidobacteriota bacterium]
MIDRTRQEFDGRDVLVVGLGRSGLAASRHLLAAGSRVTATDLRALDRLGREVEALRDAGARLVLGSHPEAEFIAADAIVISPGVPPTLPPLVVARERGIPILSEIDLAAEAVGERVVTITGSNGKSTVTSLVATMVAGGGRDAVACGNFGSPLVEATRDDRPGRLYAVELSSFQLETTTRLRAAAAILLNVQPDHLDRHGSFAAYRDAKWRIAALRRPGAPLVLAIDDPEVAPLAAHAAEPILSVSLEDEVASGGFVSGNTLMLRVGSRTETLAEASELPLAGRHNRINVLAAAVAARALGAALGAIQGGLSRFAPLPHRLQEVARVGGIRFVDDSKATNVAAAACAIRALAEPNEGGGRLVVLLGGRDKDSDFAPLSVALREARAVAMTFGEAGPAIGRVLAARGDEEELVIGQFPSLEEATRAAFGMARPGDAILLSPACASFDAYDGFAARGDSFAAVACSLAEEDVR